MDKRILSPASALAAGAAGFAAGVGGLLASGALWAGCSATGTAPTKTPLSVGQGNFTAAQRVFAPFGAAAAALDAGGVEGLAGAAVGLAFGTLFFVLD